MDHDVTSGITGPGDHGSVLRGAPLPSKRRVPGRLTGGSLRQAEKQTPARPGSSPDLGGAPLPRHLVGDVARPPAGRGAGGMARRAPTSRTAWA